MGDALTKSGLTDFCVAEADSEPFCLFFGRKVLSLQQNLLIRPNNNSF
jgi:hypothetical protein